MKQLFLPLSWISLLAFVGCQVVDDYTDCDRFNSDYEEALQDEGQLTEEIPSGEPFPMAILLSQSSLNRLFAEVADYDLDTLEWEYELDLGYGIVVPYTLGIDPELPLIQIGGVDGCDQCLLLSMGFSMYVEVYGIKYGGSGSATYQFPIDIVDNGTDSSSVYALWSQSEVVDVDFMLTGFEAYEDYINQIEPWVALAATVIIQEYYGDTELFELDAWKLGNGDIKLLGRGPYIYPDTQTIAIGIHTNLIRPIEGSITLEPSLPEGADIGMQFHPELIQQIVERMLNEGFIPRSYDLNGDVDENGAMSVALNYMEASPDGLLATSFRLWKLGGDYCGWVDISAELGLSISDKEIALTVANIDATDGDGAGTFVVAAEDWATSQFTFDMMNFSELAINYRELSLPYGKQAEMSSESFRLDIDAYGLSVYLNLDAVVDAVSEGE